MTSDLEGLLSEGLARYAQGVAAPAGLLDTARARQRRHRRRLVARTGAAAGIAAAAAAAVILAAGRSAGEPPMLTDAYVVRQVQAALSAAQANDGKVMRAVTRIPAFQGTITSWTYRDAGLDQVPLAHGLRIQAHQAAGSAVTYTFVDYPSRTWSREVLTLRPGDRPMTIPELGQLLTTPGCAKAMASRTPVLDWPGYLRAELACGAFRYSGYATMDGTRAVTLTSVQVPGAAYRETLWVSPRTYLPVRVVSQALPHLGIMVPGMNQPVVSDFQWMPPTPANVAKASATIPAGFRHVSRVPT
jgi:hypothetical protein